METIESIEERLSLVLSRDKARKPVVTVYGLMNAGKSYLLNMLTNHIEQEFFKTNDVRETTEIKKFESEQYIYLDTPGLDANTADDQLAQLGADEADVVLFVHQPQGELESIEVKLLEQLRQSFGDFSETNIVIIISKVSKESEDKINAIELKIKEQCSNILRFDPEIIQVSNSRYKKGKLKGVNELLELSNVLSVQEFIESAPIDAVRLQRRARDLDSIYSDVDIRECSLKVEKREIQRRVKDDFSIFFDLVKKFNRFVQKSIKQYKNV